MTSTAGRSWQPSYSHGTYQHEAIKSCSRQLLMMGTWLPETCWATIRREIKNTKVASIWFFLSTREIVCLWRLQQEVKCVCNSENSPNDWHSNIRKWSKPCSMLVLYTKKVKLARCVVNIQILSQHLERYQFTLDISATFSNTQTNNWCYLTPSR